MNKVLTGCAILAFAQGACLTEDDPAHVQQGTAGVSIDDDEVDGVYPPPAWVAPALLFDGNFPGGVLSFATAQGFVDFYQALDTVLDSDGAANDVTGTTPYDAANTSSATVNYKSFTVRLAAGQVLDAGTCDLEESAFTGDTYLRLFLGGSELATSDDACGGVGSKLSYTATTAGTYELRMGCFSSGTCNGTVGYSISTPGAGGLGGVRSFAGAATNSATGGFSTIMLQLSQGQVLDVGTCGVAGSSFTGDTFLRLVDVELNGNVEVAASDDACSTGSRITYTVPRTGSYQVRLGCFSTGSCTGTVAYTVTAEPGARQMLPPGFSGAADLLANRTEAPGDAIIDAGADEYALDLKEALTEDDTMRQLVDRELQVVVEGRLYQITNMGVFQVEMSSLAAYRAWFAANANAINVDPSFQSIPGEVPLGNGAYQVMPGVIRTVGAWGTPEVKLLGFDDDASDSENECPACLASSSTGTAALAQVKGGATTNGTDGELGRISYWFGKVNIHRDRSGPWLSDPDCTSGANIDPLTYCRKFWPTTSSVTALTLSAKPPFIWFTAGCTSSFTNIGQQEWACNGPLPSCNQLPPPINFANYPLSQRFNRKESIKFNGNKRFVFKARKRGILIQTTNIEVGFRTIYIKAKFQRKKRFLGIGYWGPSYGEEIVLGVENMKLDTDYVIPSPQMYTQLSRPKFNKLAKYKLGSKLIDIAHISVNSVIPFPPIIQQNLIDWANNNLNKLVALVYTNVWKGIENNILDAIEPGFRARYDKYTKMADAINSDHRLRWTLGAADKPACNVHKNNWTFNSNGGIKFTRNGGVPGPPGTPPAPVNFKYAMKTGAFFARGRVGQSWYGIRFVRQ